MNTWKPTHRLRQFEQAQFCYFNSEGDRVKLGGHGVAKIWNVMDGLETGEHQLPPRALDFGDFGEWMAEQRYDGNKSLVRLKVGERESFHALGRNQPVSVAVHGSRVAIGTRGGAVFVRELHTDRSIAAPQPSSRNWHRVAIDELGQQMALATTTGSIEVIDLRSRESVWHLAGNGEQINELYLSACANEIIAFEDDKVVLQKLDALGEAQTFSAVGVGSVSADGRHLAYVRQSNSQSREVVVYDLVEKDNVARVVPPVPLDLQIGFSSQTLVLADNLGTVTGYDLNGGGELWSVSLPTAARITDLNCGGALPDLRLLVSYENEQLMEWALRDRRIVATHASAVVNRIFHSRFVGQFWYSANGAIFRYDSKQPQSVVSNWGQATKLRDFEVSAAEELLVVVPGDATVAVYGLRRL